MTLNNIVICSLRRHAIERLIVINEVCSIYPDLLKSNRLFLSGFLLNSWITGRYYVYQ